MFFTPKTKHLELDLHFVREKVLSKSLKVCHIPADLQTTNGLTKPLTSLKFIDLRTKLKSV
uniref:Copia protein n=1 Tax=Lotus japonicus TaxID=34305 RepID=I3SDX0_LOTJA|nr:unknown [Lotus japonicus]